MFVFGLWHKGSLLLMMWGVYHGILLVFHRQWQEFRKWSGFQWSGLAASLLSWWLTFSAVCVGYIFFRCESVQQAFGMLKAMADLHSYGQLTLDHSLYLMTCVAAVGYFAVLGAMELLNRLAVSSSKSNLRNPLQTFFTILAKERWVWIAPAVVVLTIYLSVIFQPGHAETGPVMYALF
jgi:hypothetical protein